MVIHRKNIGVNFFRRPLGKVGGVGLSQPLIPLACNGSQIPPVGPRQGWSLGL